METKKQLRQQMRARRSALTSLYRIKASQLIGERILQWLDDGKLDRVMFYWPIQQEVDLRTVMNRRWQQGKKVILPCTHPEVHMLSCYAVGSVDELRVGAYQIKEPDPTQAVAIDPQQLQAVVVPGTAFDYAGYRMGYGGGYYDRFLAAYPHVERVGVAYPEQLCDTVYPEKFDQRLTMLITSVNTFHFAV